MAGTERVGTELVLSGHVCMSTEGGTCLRGQVQYRARNEMQSMKLGREQQEWMDDSAAALHVRFQTDFEYDNQTQYLPKEKQWF